MQGWIETVPWPVMARWWAGQGRRAQLAIALAALFALAGMLNLAAAGLGRGPTNLLPVPETSAPTALSQESAPADPDKTWVMTKVWQGSGSRETEEFTVGQHWRLDWIFSPGQSDASLQVFIRQSDGRLLANLVANNQKGGADSSFFVGAGKYFLKINSSGGDWRLAVQDLR